MGGANESVVIEIGEDAYKQNSVYRPWDELHLTGACTASNSPPSMQTLQTHLLPRLKSPPVSTPM